MFLASLLYHEQWLHQQLPSSHRLLRAAAFAPRPEVDALRQKIFAGRRTSATRADDLLLPTGIPPHVELLDQIARVREDVARIPSITAEKISSFLQENAVGLNQVTNTGLAAQLSSFLESVRRETS